MSTIQVNPLPLPQASKGSYRDCEHAMTHEYKGDSVDRFIHYLEQNNIAFNSHDYYAKVCYITQSSGTGKTRLLFELGKTDVCVLYMNIRSESGGYPLCDEIPARILSPAFLTENEYRLQCRTFFATVFKCLADFLQKEPNPFGVLSDVLNANRAIFLKQVDSEFCQVKQEVLSSSRQGIDVMHKYFAAMVTVECLERDTNRPKVVIAFDEAHVLHEKSQSHNYIPETVLFQTIREYSDSEEEAVWVVLASTVPNTTHYSHLLSLLEYPSTVRDICNGKWLFLPFTLLGWDQRAPVLQDVELDEVAWGSHLLGYGRPLWWSLKENTGIREIMMLATQKLCGSETFDPNNDRHAIAVLGQRFGLDITFCHRYAVSLKDTLITYHLLFCIKTTDNGMWCYTTYPSEPIVSAAAAEVLYTHEGGLCKALSRVSEWVDDGLIDTESNGQLASRFLWLLAKDLCVQQSLVLESSPPLTSGEVLGDVELPYCQLVNVVKFFELVFGPTFWDKVSEEVRTIFEDAFINFSHWVQAEFDITRDVNDFFTERRAQNLWVRTCAIQCDNWAVIPMYFKSRPRDSAVSYITISSVDCDGEITQNSDNIAPSWYGSAYVAIQTDLGAPPSDVIVKDDTGSTGGPCLRIYATGLSRETSVPGGDNCGDSQWPL